MRLERRGLSAPFSLFERRLLAGEGLEAVRLEDLRLLVLEEGAGGLVLAEAGASAGKPSAGFGGPRIHAHVRHHRLLGSADALGLTSRRRRRRRGKCEFDRVGLAGGGGHDEGEEAGGGGAARETPAKMKKRSRR